MIVYALRCDSGHGFDAWFKDAAAFDDQAAAGEVLCPACGSTAVAKAPMAPHIGGRAPAPSTAAPETPAEDRTVPAPTDPRAAAMAAFREKLIALRRHVEATHDYVGDRFATEIRAMHEGEAEERAIYGEATADEARELIEDGLPVAPLPVVRTES